MIRHRQLINAKLHINALRAQYMRHVLHILVFCCLNFVSSSQAAPTNSADEVVAQLQTALLESAVLADLEQRLEIVRDSIESSHDFDAIARLVTGRHWRKLGDAERAEFVGLFTELSVLRYAERFKAMGDSHFQYVETISQPRDSLKVMTVLNLDSQTSFAELSNSSELNFEYILRLDDSDEVNSGWKIINVIVDGVSDLALKRANYVSTINDDGFGALLEQLTKEIAEVKNKG